MRPNQEVRIVKFNTPMEWSGLRVGSVGKVVDVARQGIGGYTHRVIQVSFPVLGPVMMDTSELETVNA